MEGESGFCCRGFEEEEKAREDVGVDRVVCREENCGNSGTEGLLRR